MQEFYKIRYLEHRNKGKNTACLQVAKKRVLVDVIFPWFSCGIVGIGNLSTFFLCSIPVNQIEEQLLFLWNSCSSIFFQSIKEALNCLDQFVASVDMMGGQRVSSRWAMITWCNLQHVVKTPVLSEIYYFYLWIFHNLVRLIYVFCYLSVFWLFVNSKSIFLPVEFSLRCVCLILI